MDLIAELRKKGLVKEAPQKETTTTANVPTTVQPLGVLKRQNPIGDPDKEELERELQSEEFVDREQEVAIGLQDAEHGEEVVEPDQETGPVQNTELALKCIKESIHKLSEAYESMTGEKLHELYCPKCKPYDQGPAFDQDNSDRAAPPAMQNPQGHGVDMPQ